MALGPRPGPEHTQLIAVSRELSTAAAEGIIAGQGSFGLPTRAAGITGLCFAPSIGAGRAEWQRLNQSSVPTSS